MNTTELLVWLRNAGQGKLARQVSKWWCWVGARCKLQQLRLLSPRRTALPMSWASRHQVTFTESTHCQKMERSTALFLPLFLLVVVFFQEGLGLKCWHTGKTTAVSLIILEATKIPFWLRPAQNSQNPYHLKIPQIQLQGYALVTSERSAQVR